MIKVDASTEFNKALLDALRGEYGEYRMSNGIRVLHQGRFIHFEGTFGSGEESVEIPRVASRLAVIFTGDGFSCAVITEPNAGFVCVPPLAKGKRFAILSTGILNI